MVARRDARLRNIVRELRRDRGMSQAELAEAVGVTRQTVIALEKGDYVPSLLLAMNIAETLGRPIEAIFTKEVG
ncbi:helix-turn-helix transcriptional regulator [Propionibacterium australiense]|uniref:HTH_XRE n=1 Tax=Propionibacterium australiense TaxID=119981 RepID=A0A383S9K9_9ACTN|nr:helix-turn-helix transcriptional regulator [Propionibacterium australiense]RLP06590.1 helix-turn-helix domain-containing protein [Propionibacterium australiense]RLP10756.1 helix-turn-helix domain-containing protein [Propionibacterium australiense]SYZ34411.1 HTH_XRE [Propionibacterium australiense]VEH89845.1 anaerobic benzoate catabolism transcriptional regulator [Propionibacterium australiense]